MPSIVFHLETGTTDVYMAVIRQTIPVPRQIFLQAGPGGINRVDLPDATGPEVAAVEAALRTNFPRETVWGETPIVIPLVMPTVALQWLNMPSAVTEFRGVTIHRLRFSLANFRQARLAANIQVAGIAGSDLGVQASTDGASWMSLEGVSNGASPNLSLAAAGTVAGSAVDLHQTVKRDVVLRLVGRGGDVVTVPSFGLIFLQLR